MRTPRLLPLLALLLAGLPAHGAVVIGAHGSFTTAKIMPLGDSTTEGITVNVTGNFDGYRLPLEVKMRANNYVPQFVGSFIEGTLISKHHQGQGGAKCTDINAAVAGYLAANPPDIILLQCGTNDLLQGATSATALTRMDALLTTIQGLTAARIVVSVIPPIIASTGSTEFAAYNAGLIATAAAHSVTLVDPGWVAADVGDNVHPTTAGYAKQANVGWWPALKP